MLLYCTSIYHFSNSKIYWQKLFALPEDGVRTQQHVGVILILILYYFYVHFWYTTKHQLIKKHGMNIKIIYTLKSISVCAVMPVAKFCGVPADTSDCNFERK